MTNDVQFDPETGEVFDTPIAPAQPKPVRKPRAKKKPNGRAVPADETPRQRFLRRTTISMKQALTAIDLMASLGRHRANYDYDEADIARVANRLEDAIDRLRRELARPPSRKDEREAERSFSW